MQRNTSGFNRTATSARTTADTAARAKAALVHVAFAVAVVACLVAIRPAHASDVQAPAPGAVVASAELGDLRRHVSVKTSAPTDEQARSRVGAANRRDVGHTRENTPWSPNPIVEPATIAVLGFAAAALIAVRRRKNASAKSEVVA